jgi:RHS repeat-associated protein
VHVNNHIQGKQRHHLPASGSILASYVLAGPELISQRRAGSTSYYLHDGQGSVRALTDPAGAVTDRYTYVAFGELVEQEGATDNPYRYTGQQYDEASGLYSLRARYYDPSAGRFLSADPLEQWRNVRELNRYSYAANDPVNLSDPSGRQAMVEGVLSRMLTRGATGMVVGAASGLLGATAFYILAYLGACGDEAMTAARNMTPAEVDRLIGQAVVMGAAMGAIGGIYVGAGPYAAAAFKIGMGLIGMTASGLDIVTNGLNWCNGIAFAMSVAAVVHGTYKWHKLSAASHAGQTAQEQKPCADCDGGASPTEDGDAPPPGKPRQTNSKDVDYPTYEVEGYGEVPFPEGEIHVTDPAPMRNAFTKEWRMEFRRWWYDEYGWYPSPDVYDIHHIQPVSRGGTNDFTNLVPILRGADHQQFATWWLSYP